MGEVIKHAMLDGKDGWDFLEKNLDKILSRDPAVLSDLIASNAAFKASVVNADLRESGIRAHLNLGHTFGHALESVTGFSGFSHGEGVAWGLNAALKTGLKLGITNEAWAQRVVELLKKAGYRLTAPGTSPEALLTAMQVDKKRKGGKVRYILQKDRGQTLITEVDDKVILSVLSDICS
jgi:3-dehydroquinate synthase